MVSDINSCGVRYKQLRCPIIMSMNSCALMIAVVGAVLIGRAGESFLGGVGLGVGVGV